jgi:hypothetical protein
LSVGQINDRILLRLANAGNKRQVPSLQYLRGEVLAEDGFAYNFPGDQYAIDLPPAKTKDVRIVPAAVGTYPLYDHALGLVNNTALGGGMMVKLNVGSATPVINAVTATPAAIWYTQTSQLLWMPQMRTVCLYRLLTTGSFRQGQAVSVTRRLPIRFTLCGCCNHPGRYPTVEVTDGATTVSSYGGCNSHGKYTAGHQCCDGKTCVNLDTQTISWLSMPVMPTTALRRSAITGSFRSGRVV